MNGWRTSVTSNTPHQVALNAAVDKADPCAVRQLFADATGLVLEQNIGGTVAVNGGLGATDTVAVFVN